MATAARLNAILADADERSHRSIVTPEGVALPVELAARSERAAAFLIDLLIITGCFIALGLLALAAGLLGFSSRHDRGIAIWIWIALLLGWFVVRSFYFALFELRWHGSTPGKRVFRLRVIDRAGGALTADAVIARNLMREIEVFLPVVDHGGARNRHERPGRAGHAWLDADLHVHAAVQPRPPAGRRHGRRDLGDHCAEGDPPPGSRRDRRAARRSGRRHRTHVFSSEQLDAYGIYELQTLEQVLRQEGTNAPSVREEVAKRIQRKINWTPAPDLRFDGASLPAGLLHRPAPPPRGAGPARQAAQGQARPRGGGQAVAPLRSRSRAPHRTISGARGIANAIAASVKYLGNVADVRAFLGDAQLCSSRRRSGPRRK